MLIASFISESLKLFFDPQKSGTGDACIVRP
jgi:hypothetical protein